MQATMPGESPTAESGKDASTALTQFMLKREPDFYGQESKPLDHTLRYKPASVVTVERPRSSF